MWTKRYNWTSKKKSPRCVVDPLNRARKRNLEEARSNLNEIDRPRLKAVCEITVCPWFFSTSWKRVADNRGKKRCSSTVFPCCDSATRARDNYRWRATENVRQNQLTVVPRCHRSAWTAERSIIYRVSRSRN